MNIHFSCCCLDSRKRNAILCGQELTQKRETRGLYGGSAFYFPVALSWVSKLSKISLCSQLYIYMYINIYKYPHKFMLIYPTWRMQQNSFAWHIFCSNMMLFFPFFCVLCLLLRQGSNPAVCKCIFSDLTTILHQRKVARTVPMPCPVVCRKVAKLGHKSLTWAQFYTVYIEKFKVNPTRRRWQEAVTFTACVTKSQLVWNPWAGALLFCSAFFSSPAMNFLAGEFWAPQVFFEAFVKGSRGTEESWAEPLPWDEAPARAEGF